MWDPEQMREAQRKVTIIKDNSRVEITREWVSDIKV